MFGLVLLVGIVNIICVLLDDLLVTHRIELSKVNTQIYIWITIYLIFASNASKLLLSDNPSKLLISIALLFVGSLIYSTTNALYLYVLLTIPISIMFMNENNLVHTCFLTPLFLSSYYIACV